MPDHELRNCGYWTAARESLHGEGEFLEVVLPAWGDTDEKHQKLLCALRQITDKVNELYGLLP